MATDFERLKAALAERYAIERELGQGGMATVYLARDLKHDRLVAIKVLHPELAASMGSERFLREIQITAKLSHPHILPLYDSGEADGFLYYVMPFVEGESLASKVTREKQLSIEESIQITREVAEALAQAHSYGLIHRDIKPENIMLSGGHAVVADFGIARALSEAGGERMTQTGMTIGTPAYMSPEQGAGDPDLDGRSDIYSLACVLYELLIGQIPFTGPTPQAIIARHSMDHITPPSIMRNTIPPELEDIIHCAMAKVPADRFRTAQEFAEALQAVATGGTPKVRRTTAMRRSRPTGRPAWARVAVSILAGAGVVGIVIAAWFLFRPGGGRGSVTVTGLDPRNVAVMYFSADSATAYLASGLTEGLIADLSQVGALQVRSQSAVARYRDSELPRDSIARTLDVGSLIVGSIEPVGDRVRITARLVDGTSAADIDRMSLEMPPSQILAARDSVVDRVAGFLRRRIGEEVTVRKRRTGTNSVAAWTLLQRAEQLKRQADGNLGHDPNRSVQLYGQADSVAVGALAADPQWAEPFVLRAKIAYNHSFVPHESYEQAPRLRRSIQLADSALGRDVRDAAALAVRGSARYRLWTIRAISSPTQQATLLDSAQADLEAATQTDNSLAAAYLTLSRVYLAREDNVSSALAARRAYEADAYLSNMDANLDQLFWVHYNLEQFPDAKRWCETGASRFPDETRFVECQLWLMLAPPNQPDVAKAWQLAARFDSLAPKPDSAWSDHLGRLIVGGVIGRAAVAAANGALKDSADHVLRAARASREVDPDEELTGYEAIMRIRLGAKDEAIDLLKQYILVNPDHEFTVQGDLHWWWRPLRDDPGFQAIVARKR